MAPKIRFGENEKLLPVLAPVAVTTTAVMSQYVKVSEAQWATFEVGFGLVGSSNDTDVYTVTVECSTANTSNATEVAIDFRYRLTAAVGTDSMGAITTASTAGASVKAETDETKTMLIEVDPAALPAALTDGKYLRVVITPPTADTDATAVCYVSAILDPRYPGNAMRSAT
jgi:hypothetical protein